jgi:uracil-DNA glycosylase
MTKPYVCPRCGHRYSIKERNEDEFCSECEKRLIKWTNAKGLLRHAINELVDRDSFIKQIYSNVVVQENCPLTECDRCFAIHQFSRLSNFHHKPCFPPIGSSDKGQVLFVGSNPRCRRGTKDEDFYRHALSSPENFLQFSIDGRYEDSKGYPKWLFNDPHYRIHKDCLAEVDPSWVLGQKSSVAEIFMCGSKDSNIFSGRHDYICAKEYLIKYIGLVKPEVIVSFGSLALQWFQMRYRNDLKGNMKYLDDTVPKNYVGDPLRSGIADLHACFSEVKTNSGCTPTAIFSYHPSWMQNELALLKTFRFVMCSQSDPLTKRK